MCDGRHELPSVVSCGEVDIGWVAVLIAEPVGADGTEEGEVFFGIDGAIGEAGATEEVCHFREKNMYRCGSCMRRTEEEDSRFGKGCAIKCDCLC